MKFSVIIPTLNVQKNILKTLDSVCVQTYKELEILIMDGGSNDCTINLVEKKRKYEHRIQLFSSKDSGIYDAMNKGVRHAAGDYCIFLGAGDTFCNTEVLQTIAYYKDVQQFDIVYGFVLAAKKEDGNSSPLKRRFDWQYAIRFLPICHQAVLAKRKLLLEQPFDTSYKIAADQDWLLRMKKQNRKSLFIDIPICNFSYDGLSSTEQGNKIFIREQDQIHKKYYPIWGMLITSFRNFKYWFNNL